MHSTDNLDDGYFGSGVHLKHSIKFHGKEKHSKEILEFAIDRETLIKREKVILSPQILEDINCMNLVSGGVGTSHNESTASRISKALKGRKRSTAHNEAMSNALKNRPKSIEHRQKISESLLNVKHSNERKAAISEATKNAMTEDAKKKISTALTGKKLPTETKNKIADSLLGIQRSEETKLKMSIAKKLYWQNKKQS
jgi:hypothetical protein